MYEMVNSSPLKMTTYLTLLNQNENRQNLRKISQIRATTRNGKWKIYCNNPLFTDRTIGADRSDMTMKDKPNKITYILDVAMPNDHNTHSTNILKIL